MTAATASRAAWRSFASPQELAEALAGRIAGELQAAVEARGAATLALSGGKTPVRLFQALARQDIAWRRVTVTLVDERFVPATDDRSNAKLVADNLLTSKAAEANFVPLYRAAADVEGAARLAGDAIAGLPLPLDVAILGMGADGHFASFFPDAENLAGLMKNRSGRAVLPVHARSAGEPRLTLSLQLLSAARFVALHIEGEEKKRVLEDALAKRDRPVSAFFGHSASGVQVFWAP